MPLPVGLVQASRRVDPGLTFSPSPFLPDAFPLSTDAPIFIIVDVYFSRAVDKSVAQDASVSYVCVAEIISWEWQLVVF